MSLADKDGQIRPAGADFFDVLSGSGWSGDVWLKWHRITGGLTSLEWWEFTFYSMLFVSHHSIYHWSSFIYHEPSAIDHCLHGRLSIYSVRMTNEIWCCGFDQQTLQPPMMCLPESCIGSSGNIQPSWIHETSSIKFEWEGNKTYVHVYIYIYVCA